MLSLRITTYGTLLSILLTSVIQVSGCQSGGQIATPAAKPTKGPNPETEKNPEDLDANPDDTSSNATEVPTEYPSYSFKGNGDTSYDSDTFQSTSSVETSISDDFLTLNQTARTIDLRGKGGSSKQREADDKIKRTAIGPTKYRRALPAERRKLGELNVPYAIFASEVTTVSGKTYKFDPVVPVFPFPGKANRYVDFEGSKSFRSNVTCTGCTGFSQFGVIVTMSKSSESGDQIGIKFETSIEGSIPGGTGVAWHGFPLPKSASFAIDTNKGILMGMETTHLFLQKESSGGEERSSMRYKICEYKKGSENESFSCP